MTSADAPDNPDDRTSHLLDLAYEGSPGAHDDLSAADRQELARLRVLIAQIDAAWTVPDERRDRVRALFLRQLAAKNPEHPWVRSSTVRTLGDLVAAAGGDVPALPRASYERLVADQTPIEVVLDRTQRTAAIGRALRLADVPSTIIGDFLLWLNRLAADLVPPPGPTGQGLLYARRQRTQEPWRRGREG